MKISVSPEIKTQNNMNYKRFIKKLFLFFCLLITIYLLFILIEGGFGKKPVNIDNFDTNYTQLLFAHRGIAKYYPENTLKSIQEAKIRGFKAVEVDVRKSLDDEFVIFHDDNCKRLLGIDAGINSLDISTIKKHPIVGGNKTGCEVLTLKEMLKYCKNDFLIYLDLKISSFKDVNRITDVIIDNGAVKSTIVASYDLTTIIYIEIKHPEINTALEGFNPGKEWIYCLIPKNLKPDFLSGFADKVDEKHILWLKRNNLMSSRIVHGVTNENYNKIIRMGLKNMIIDYDSTISAIVPDHNTH